MNATTLIQTRSRIESIDYLRGIVMVIMAIDHVRDFFHRDSFYFSPTDVAHTTPALFFTRWITHLCAPTFIFLAGTSAYFILRRNSREYTSFFLLTRGLWLIVLQVTLVRLVWQFDPLFHYNGSTIISTIGFCMMILAVLIRFSTKTILIVGLAVVFGHNALDSISFQPGSLSDVLWTFLHGNRTYDLGNGYAFNFLYPVLPWAGVMAVGYSFGQLYEERFEPEKRKKMLVQLGSGVLLLFFILRYINVYGDPVRWSEQPTVTGTVMSFFNVAKYPPSLLFILATLGISLLLLATLEGKQGRANVFGKGALFYYVLHLLVIHLLALVIVVASGHSWTTMIFYGAVAEGSPELLKENFGFGLGVVYLVWIIAIAILYPSCVWWTSFKARNKHKWWVSYV